jgi:hypothetical protein
MILGSNIRFASPLAAIGIERKAKTAVVPLTNYDEATHFGKHKLIESNFTVKV